MRKFRFGIGRKVGIGYLAIIILSVLMGITGSIILIKSRNIDENLSEVYIPSLNHLKDLNQRITQASRLTNSWVYQSNINDRDQIANIAKSLPELENVILNKAKSWENEQWTKSLNTVLLNSNENIDKQKEVLNILKTFDDFDNDVKIDEAIVLLDETILPSTKSISAELKKLIEQIDKHAKDKIEKKYISFNILQISLVFLIVMVVGISWFASHYTNVQITKPIIHIKDRINELSDGKLPKPFNENSNDEIGDITSSVNILIEGLRKRTDFTKKIGKGDFDASFEILSSEDELGNSLIYMRDSLKMANEKEKIEKWKVDGIAKVSDLLQRAISVHDLAEEIINLLVEYLDIGQGVIYVLSENIENKEYYIAAEHAQSEKEENENTIIKYGKGLIGQAIKSRKLVYLENLDNNERSLSTRYALVKLNNIIILPLATRDNVVGVLELASLKPFKENEIAFLDELSEKIAFAINNLISQEQTDNLLKEIEKKNQELLSSEEELRQNAEETKMINERLATSHAELETSMAELQLAKKESEQANQAKTQFLANMSHEIRSPLNAIVGFSQIMVNMANKLKLPFNFKDNLSHIIHAGQNLSELINNILDLSKIESGKMEILIESINFKQLVQGIFHINKESAQKKKINYTYNYAPNLPEFVQSDRTKLNQILMNLASNAIKFTPKHKSILIEADLEDDMILLKVKDEGIGIDEDRLDKVFESFEQADNTITRSFGGTGLGLSISKEMVEMLGGEIWVESTKGKGSTFFVKIPLIHSDSHEGEVDNVSIENFHFLPDNVVLAVEDIEMNQQMLKSLFDELQLEIQFASSGREGIRKVKKLKPDLVLMDIHMPGMDGMEATRRIREIPEFKTLPIVALSADAFIEQQNKALEAGVNEYITKPIDFDKLLPVLSKYLREDKSIVVQENNDNELPQEELIELKKGFTEMLSIPFTDFEVVDRKVQAMKEICEGYKSQYGRVLDQIEDYLFSGQTESIQDVIENAIEMIAKEEIKI